MVHVTETRVRQEWQLNNKQLQAHLISISTPGWGRGGIVCVCGGCPLFLIASTKVSSSFKKSSGIKSFWPSLCNMPGTNYCGLKDGMLWASLYHIFTAEVSVQMGWGVRIEVNSV